VILDMAPSLDVLHVAGLLAAHTVLIPTKLRFTIWMRLRSDRSIQEVSRHGHTILQYVFLQHFSTGQQGNMSVCRS
jgi:cellulose biosynthesis protein BcsQ